VAHTVLAIFFIGMQDHFRITFGFELVALLQKFFAEQKKVVNLSVKNNHH
jgi:hypothetical protein